MFTFVIALPIVIFVYIAPSAQSCQRKNTGDWLSGTLTGISTTISNSNPNINGIRPAKSTRATLDFAP